MFVSDFYDDAKYALEGCAPDTIFRRLTDAVKLVNDQGILDVQTSQMEICTCFGCNTLPREVGTVLGINVNGYPTLLRDQWFQYHLNGSGSNGWAPFNITDELGQVCTFRDPSEPAYLVAEVTSAADNGKKLRVYAYDTNGKKIYTPGPDGKLYEGFLVPTIFGYSQRNPSAPALSSIYRVQKEATRDYVKLYAINASDSESQTLIGQYEPEETIPQYRRIRTNCKSSVRIKYKRADLEIRSLRDWININNRQALLAACRAVKFRMTDKWAQARQAEDEAVRLLQNEANSQRPPGALSGPRIINGCFNDNGDGLYYGTGDGGDGRWM